MARRLVRVLISIFLALFAALAISPAAWAHATLVTTSPADGSVVTKAPASVSATFDEAVGVSADSLRVFAPNGQRADNGSTKQGTDPQQVTVGLLPGISNGTYTVSWHVVSADSHAVSGAFTFSVGAPSSTVPIADGIAQSASRLTDAVFAVARWLGFFSFAVLVGAVMFVICCWPVAASRPGMLRLVMGGWGALAAATLAAILLQGVYGADQGISHLFWPDVLHATLHSRYGQALGVRLLLVVLALFVFSVTLGSLPRASRRGRIAAGTVWATLTVALAGTWAVADHAGTGIQVPLALPSDIVHLSAVAVWIGGLVTLITVALRGVHPADGAGRAERRRYQTATTEAARAVSCFSPIALGCVIAIVLSGTYQAWRGVGSISALMATTYGRLLLLKIAGMCGLIVLGNLARVRVQRLRAPVEAILAGQTAARRTVPAEPARVGAAAGARSGRRGSQGVPRRHGGANTGPASNGVTVNSASASARAAEADAQLNADGAALTLSRLRRSVWAEVAIAVSVLAVTAVLVNTPTARETYIPPVNVVAAFDTGGPGGRGDVNVRVAPARIGPNQLFVKVTDSAGRPYRAQQVQAALTLPGNGFGRLPVQLTADGPGTYRASAVIMTIAGQWRLRLTVRSDAFDETTVELPVPVR